MKIVNGFIFKIVTQQAVEIWDKDLFPIFILHEDDTESLIESLEELIKAINNDSVIGIEVGKI